MADSDISGLTGSLTSATLASGDNFVVDDVSDTETTKKITAVNLANGLAQIATAFPMAIIIECSDESTAIDATGEKAEFRMPFAFTVTEVRAHLNSACTTGTFTVDINESGVTILSTKLTIDATEKSSETAATAPVISDSSIADDAEIQIDVDNVGDSTGTGLKVVLIGTADVSGV